ncbi:2-phosphosulfolactate phosphatase [Fervidicella metallireducens AeB]|uniref:Probable 2-phosphosulfolactate phosphatase n=1 Tax=Fervidicella metallireducens AeB TaxID=1403537 RepID=A0A017RV02_9CLOT|nr:2-phosphosulfolactate phosphatase [Fervidicella metallireducens]EYE88497.1 2-phosphosulfolactate phosphatase [Fervidicella metallireducens AeB]
MKISLIPSIEYVDRIDLKGKVAVVIDVLRATSVIITALSNGAKEVVATTEIDETFKLKNNNSIIGGERKALKINGFDLSNSPLEYQENIVRGKRVILNTTNGTKAINKCSDGAYVFIGGIINGKAVSKKIAEIGKDVVFVCSGTDGKFSLDDYICAGKIIYNLLEIKNGELEDLAATAYMAYRDNKGDLFSYVKMASHYKYMISIGLEEDIEYCFQEDIVDIVPEVKNGKII